MYPGTYGFVIGGKAGKLVVTTNTTRRGDTAATMPGWDEPIPVVISTSRGWPFLEFMAEVPLPDKKFVILSEITGPVHLVGETCEGIAFRM